MLSLYLRMRTGLEAGDIWTLGQTTATSLRFILPEAEDRWAPGQTFTTSHLSILQNKNNNRRKENTWYLLSVNLLTIVMTESKEGLSPLLFSLDRRTKRSCTPYPQDQEEPNYTSAEKPLWGRKGGGARP